MNSDFLRREWGAIAFLIVTALGIVVVPIGLNLNKQPATTSSTLVGPPSPTPSPEASPSPTASPAASAAPSAAASASPSAAATASPAASPAPSPSPT